MKLVSLISALFLSCMCIHAQGQKGRLPEFTFGVEWGYVATLQYGYHNNFFSLEGNRVDRRGNVFQLFNNADAYIHAGYNINHLWNVSAYVGCAGLADNQSIMPISVRATRYFGEDYMKDRWLCFADLGSGISLKKHPQEILVGKLGGGYRISLSRISKLDFIASVRITYSHDNINYYGYEIEPEYINRNNIYASALSLGISLTF